MSNNTKRRSELQRFASERGELAVFKPSVEAAHSDVLEGQQVSRSNATG